MNYWAISSGDQSGAVKLDVRDLGGHLDVTRRDRAGTLANQVTKATSKVHTVSDSLFCFCFFLKKKTLLG